MVLEHFQNDTADFADILLPATTFLEHTDLYFAYGHFHLQLARPALPAPGEALPNTEVFRRLAARMGFDEPCFADSDDDMIRQLLDSRHPFIDGISLEELDEKHSVRVHVADPFLPFAEGGFGTPSGKCEFRAETLGFEPPVESRAGDRALAARYPLELISPKNDDSMNSTFGYRHGYRCADGRSENPSRRRRAARDQSRRRRACGERPGRSACCGACDRRRWPRA